MQDWIAEELKIVQAEQEAFGVGDRIPFWKCPIGATKFEIDTTHPVFSSKFEGKKVFHIFVEGEKFLWTVPVRSKTYGTVIKALAEDKVKFTLIRIGSGAKDTRYELVAL
jgi:hypothetical protein